MMKKKGLFTIVLALWIVLCLSAAPALAKGNLKLGRLKILTSLKYKGEYDSNVFYKKQNVQDDFMHWITPTINFEREGSDANSFLRGGYAIDFVFYSNYNENNYIRHQPYIAWRHTMPSGVYFQVTDTFLYTSDPYGTENQFLLGVPQATRWNNILGLTLGYTFAEKYGIEGFYKNELNRFEEEIFQWQDRIDNSFGGYFLYNFTPKTSLLAEYRRTQAEYNSQNDGISDAFAGTNWSSTTSQDYKLNDFYVGMRFKPGGKLLGEFKLGLGNKVWDNEFDISGNSYNDQDTWISESSLTYYHSQKTTLDLTFDRKILGAPDATGQSFADTLLSLYLSQALVHRWTLRLGVSFNNNNYFDVAPGLPDKYFNRYRGEIGADWAIKDWLTAGVDGLYEIKTAASGWEDSEYELYRGSVYLKAEY